MFEKRPTILTKGPTVAVKEARINRQQDTNSTVCGSVEVSRSYSNADEEGFSLTELCTTMFYKLSLFV